MTRAGLLLTGFGDGGELSEKKTKDSRAQQPIKSLGRLAPYVLRYRKMMIGAIFALTVAAITSLAIPLAVRRMIDHGFSQADGTFINSYFTMLMVMAVLLAMSSALRYYFVITLGERVVSDLRRDVFAHVTRLSPAFFDVNQSGEIVSRLTADTTQIKSAVGSTASVALRNLILCLGATAMMVVTAPSLAALALGAIPVIVFPLVAFGRSVRRLSRTAQDTLASASAYAGETISATRTVQAFNGEQQAADRYSSSVEAAFEAARAAIRARSFLTGFAITLVFGSVVGVLWFGAHNVLAGSMSAGTLGQFLLYAVIAAGSLGALSEVWGELSQAAGATDRLTELLDEVPAIAAPSKPVALPVPAKGDIALSGISFAYPSRPGAAALKELSFHIHPGETVALVGPSGAGKSSVFSLLLRFYDPEKGTIRIDGTDIRTVTPEDLRNRIALVPQDVTIFDATIHDNIAFGRPDASRDQVRAAAIAAQADEFIQRLDKGYDTEVGERGVTLSGGQRQRVAIARAILRDAPILLLDEATSALDAENEILVQKALDGLMQGRTTLVIAHRLATILKADRILVMSEGRIVEEGTHQSLLRHHGLYSRLAKLQFEAGSEANIRAIGE
ncbi:ABC transporter transmembrane domain-containing protein [Oryzifoliimicrobium ureilyticus]|uniref:ABC transporter transmembrane domain-containing protein n=1 Tax=Oryzifoliimicrobium ureilyticus TaxID=3113724 RepID=UPI0030766988